MAEPIDTTGTTVLQGAEIPTEMPETEETPQGVPGPQAGQQGLFDPTAGQFQQPVFMDQEEVYELEQEQAEDRPGFLDQLQAAVETEWASSWAERTLDLQGFKADPDFSLEGLDEERKALLYDGLTSDDVDRLGDTLDEAVSWEHAQAIRENYDEVAANREILQASGWSGTALQAIAAIGDPTVLALGALTGSIGAWGALGSKATRLGRALKTGGIVAAESAAVETYLASQDPFRGNESVLMAAVAGFGIGGAFGAATRPAATNAIDEIAATEAVRRGAARRTDGMADAARIDEDFNPYRVREPDNPHAPDPSNAGAGDGGAAFNRLMSDDVKEVDEELLEAARIERPPQDAAKGELNIRGRLFGSKHDLVAWGSERLFPTLHGRGGRGDAPVNAMDRSTRHFRASMTKTNRQYLPLLKSWKKRNAANYPGWSKLSNRPRDDFAVEVGRTVRNPAHSTDPDVQKAADVIREANREFLERAQRSGLRGWENIPENPQYLMRLHSDTGLRSLEARLGSSMQLRAFIGKAIQRGSEGVDDDTATLLAEAYLSALKRSHAQSEVFAGRMFAGNEPEVIKEQLLKAAAEDGASDAIKALSEIDIDRIAKMFDAVPTPGAETTRGRRRLQLDESTTMPIRNTRGEVVDMARIDEMFENNVENLMERYARQMSGAIGLAEAGFKRPDADFDKLIQSIENTRGRYLTPDDPGEWLDADIKAMRLIHNAMMGRPVMPTMNETGRTIARSIRSYQFARVMGQVGIAQIPDMFAAAASFGVRNMLDQVPALRGMVTRAADGRLTDDLADELENVLAPGTDRLLDQPLGRFADGINEGTPITRTERTLHHINRTVSDVSGMNIIQGISERWGARAAAQRIAKMALGAPGTRPLSPQRLESMGLTGEWQERVFSQLKQHSKFTEGGITGRRLAMLDLENWDDIPARERFIDALHQWTRKAIQRNDPQDLAVWMHHDLGKLFVQFRTFGFVSWSKQLMHGVRMHDADAALMATMGLMGGALAYTLKTAVNAPGRDDPEKYLEENLTPEKIGTGAFYRANWSSLLPMGVDSALTLGGMDPVFAHGRSTGMANDLLLGNPSVDSFNQMAQATGGATQALLDPDQPLTQGTVRDIWGLVPFQNTYFAAPVGRALQEQFPE